MLKLQRIIFIFPFLLYKNIRIIQKSFLFIYKKHVDFTKCESSTLYWLLLCQSHFNILTNTPDPRIPPKYQTSTVMCSLSTEFPPGKKSRMLHSTHTIDRGIRLIPRHLAKLPEHILTRTLQSTLQGTTLGSVLKPN